ncbi:MAG: hypothetical protein JST39_23270, partial [Bacteroidetes bacterium]|nr:hypothetical protein [Bacteroidota bacterium]
MKKYIVYACLLIGTAAPALAQQKPEQDRKIGKAFDSALQRLGRVDYKNGVAVKKVFPGPLPAQQLFDGGLAALAAQAESSRKEMTAKKEEYLPAAPGGPLFEKDVLPLFSELPEPITDLQKAKQE